MLLKGPRSLKGTCRVLAWGPRESMDRIKLLTNLLLARLGTIQNINILLSTDKVSCSVPFRHVMSFSRKIEATRTIHVQLYFACLSLLVFFLINLFIFEVCGLSSLVRSSWPMKGCESIVLCSAFNSAVRFELRATPIKCETCHPFLRSTLRHSHLSSV